MGQVAHQEGCWASSGFNMEASLKHCSLGLMVVHPNAMDASTVLKKRGLF